MISALTNSELSRDAVFVRGRSWRICEKKHLIAPTQSLIQQELGAISQAFTEWAEKKDTVCNTRSLKPWTSFCYVLSWTEVVRPYGTTIRVKLTPMLDNCFSVCMSSIWVRHPCFGLKDDKLSVVLPFFDAWAPVEFRPTPMSFTQLKHYINLTSTGMYQNQQRRLST